MDISVSHLNNRLGLQLPTELPLGLVFVTGHITNLPQSPLPLSEDAPDTVDMWFDLIEVDHILRCRVSPRAMNGAVLENGLQIRAGGHLAFDPFYAGYYLLARDIEVVQPLVLDMVEEDIEPLPEIALPEPERVVGRRALPPHLADIKRRAEVTKVQEGILPPWVQKMAPPEIQEELKTLTATQIENGHESPNERMSEKLIAVLSQAMDSGDDVEVTKDMVAVLSPASVGNKKNKIETDPYKVPPPFEGVESEAEEEPLLPTTADWRLYTLVGAIILVLVGGGVMIGLALGG